MANPTNSEKNQISLNEAFQKGIECYQHQRIDEAKRIFLQILDYVPESVDVLQVLAVIENDGGKWKKAIKYLDNALSYSPNNLSVLFDKAIILFEQGFVYEASDLVNVLLKSAPENSDIITLKNKIEQKITQLKHKKNHKPQATAASPAIPTDPNVTLEIEKTLATANLLVEQGHFEQAETLFQAILSLSNDHPKTLLQLARLKIKQDNFALARQTLLRMKSHLYEKADPLILIAYCCNKLHFFKEARKYIHSGQSMFTNELMFYQLEIISYEKQKNWAEAVKLAEDICSAFPNHPDLTFRLAYSSFNLMMARINFTPEIIMETLRKTENAIKFAPTSKQIRLIPIKAQILYLKGSMQEAKGILEQFCTNHPDVLEAQFNLSFIYRASEDWDKYYDAFELGIEAGTRIKCNSTLPMWTIADRDATLFVMPEQGLGDELLYFHNLGVAIDHAKKVIAGCDPRLLKMLAHSFPEVEFIPIKRTDVQLVDIPIKKISQITHWISIGSLTSIYYQTFKKHVHQDHFIQFQDHEIHDWKEKINELKQTFKVKKVVGICWKSGLSANTRNVQYMNANEVGRLVSQCKDTLFINLQYVNFEKDLAKIQNRYGVHIHHFQSLDLKDDLLNTAKLIQCLDAVISASTAVHRLTNAIGTPCHVFFSGTDTSISKPCRSKLFKNETFYHYKPMENKRQLIDAISNEINHG